MRPKYTNNKPTGQRKILIVGPVPPPYGGIATYIKNLIESDIKNRYQLLLFNTHAPMRAVGATVVPKRAYSELFKQGMQRALLLMRHAFISFTMYFITLIIRRPHIVHIHTCSFWGFWRSAAYLVAAKATCCKVVFHIHGSIDIFYQKESRCLGRFLIRKTLNLADINIALSEELRNFISKITSAKVVAVHNGIDTDKFCHQLNVQNKKRVYDKKKRIITIAPLCHDKGTFDILKSIPLVTKKQSDILFVFIGRGSTESFMNICKEQRIEAYTQFMGPVSDEEKIEQLSSADIFILPSYAEGQPIAILEAMFFGLPIIASAIGSIPEVIHNGENGYTIKPGDFNALSEKIMTLISDDELRKRVGLANRRLVEEKYNVKNVFIKVNEIYESLFK
ncbi:glycosyltransferase family 4 protein [Candidatus Omnitrophota bacterium]